MPEQASAVSNAVTPSAIQAPFQTPTFVYGMGGLNLAVDVTKVPPGGYSRLTNIHYLPGSGQMTGRLGQTALATTGGTTLHSAVRMNDPENATFTRVWGADTDLLIGQSGALVTVDSGYSGDPLYLLPHRPPLSGDPWTFVADSLRMRKVRADGLDLPIGLPPAGTPAVALAAENRTDLVNFHSGDPSAGSNWTPNAGTDFADPPVATGVPTQTDLATASNFNGNAGAADITKGYYNYWGLATTANWNLVGAVAAEDDDIVQVDVTFGNPALVAELRIYIVVSAVFSPSVLPGTTAGVNEDFYIKAFRPGDFSGFISAWEDQITAAETARINAEREASLSKQSEEQGFAAAKGKARKNVQGREIAPGSKRRGTVSPWASQRDPARDLTKVGSAGSLATTEYGTVGIPLRRGDFKRYGTASGRDWGTITGVILVLQALPADPTITKFDPANLGIFVTLADLALTGGAGPDSMDPAGQPYDYRVTHYDPRTGAEGNPGDVMADANAIDALRRGIVITAAGTGDVDIRQRFYRRGGTLNDNWYFVGESASDGGGLTDVETDAGIEAAGTVETDHYEPVPTVDDAGVTILAQPVPVLFGPCQGMLFACGDPHRPGHLYACIPDEPDHWPPDLVDEVCPPSEELMGGCLFGGQPYVFSRARGYTVYPNLAGERGISTAPSGCTRGLVSRWGLTVGAGFMWFVATDGIFATTGGTEQDVSQEIRPLFEGKTVNGYLPIDFTVPTAIRLQVYREELWFGYQDTGGAARVLVLHVGTKQWRAYRFGQPQAALVSEGTNPTDALLILGGRDSGEAYTHAGTSDDGTAIAAVVRTGAQDFGRPREEKLLGDQYLDADPLGIDVTLINYLNGETVTNPSNLISGVTGRTRLIFDGFYASLDGPQRARDLAAELSWSTDQAPPILYQGGVALTEQPDLTVNRVTNWDDLGHPDVSYVTGITLDCDTGGADRTIIIERDYGGIVSALAILTVNHAGRHKHQYSWPGLPAHQVRIRPDDACVGWLLYRADWLSHKEPPLIVDWDIHWENGWDQYYTGLDLYCDTFGQTKQIQIEVDGVVLTDPQTLNPWWDVTTTGRQVVHLTLPWGRGHVFHFIAIDANPGQLYDHKWHLVAEPAEQWNFNEVFTVAGTLSDKWLKGVLVEIDTFGQDKVVEVDVDDIPAAVSLPTVNTSGRLVVHVSFPQVRGRVFRLFSTDGVPCRKYSHQWIFDEEPLGLSRWETQEIDHGLGGFHYLIEGMITIRAEDDVTLTIVATLNQATGATRTEAYVIPATGTAKVKRFVPFLPMNGVLYKYLFTSATPFWLYGVESHVVVQPFDGSAARAVSPFGDDDADPSRPMVNSGLAAARSGGVAS